MVKFNPKPKTVVVGCLLLLAAAAAYLLRSDLTRVSASVPPSAALAGPTCNVISGFVYQDLNNNGVRDMGEGPLPVGSTLELRNASNVVVATTTTDVNGFYQFTADATVNTSPQTITHTATFPVRSTNWSDTMTVPQFNQALGMLTSVKINNTASITSNIQVENTSTTSTNVITATVGGNVTVSAPGVPTLTAMLSQPHPDGPFNASTFVAPIDFLPPSGKMFSPSTASGNTMTTLTAAADLNLYTGAGNVTISASAMANSKAEDTAGSIATLITSTAGATVTVTYTYTPSNCLAAGNYRIIQTSPEPPGFVDGCESRGNVKILGSDTTDFIDVTLATSDLPDNNFGEVRATDLQITKTDNQTTTMPGSALTYQIVVRNNGPTAVTNATVTDTFPASHLTGVTWTCAGAGGGTCGAPNGAGSINTTVTLPVNATATFTVNATVLASASGTISNTAVVTAPPGIVDTNPNNNSSTDTTDVNTNTDLAITKTDGLTEITLNSLLTYTIVVTNNGPTAVTNAPVADTLPPNLDAVTAFWSCTATAGSSCAAPSGVSHINTTVSLAVGGKATFELTAKVIDSNPSVITNTATVAAPPNITDTNPGNNSATDTTLIATPCPTPAPTAGAPTTVRGFATSGALPQGDLFLLPNDLRFTLVAPAAGGASFFAVGDATVGGNPGFAGVTSSGFAASAPSLTTQFVSCLDSFRELAFVLAAKGNTEGDVVRFFVQNPDGTGQTVLAAFRFEGGAFKVTQVDAGVTLLANGNLPAPVGTPIPLVMTLGDSQRTAPVSLALSQSGALAGCFQLVTEVTRGGFAGATSVVLTNVNVNRNPLAGDVSRPDAGLLGGLTGGFPTGARCDAVCAPLCPPPAVCDERVCFRTPDYYCARGITLSVRSLRIPQINFGNPVPVRAGGSVSPVVLRYLGCGFYVYEATGSVGRMLTRYYLAAQISLAADPQRPDPCKLNLGCFLMMMGGMPSPIPVTLSNGFTITANTNLQDFFKQTESAILEGRAADAALLLKIYKSLGCGD